MHPLCVSFCLSSKKRCLENPELHQNFRDLLDLWGAKNYFSSAFILDLKRNFETEIRSFINYGSKKIAINFRQVNAPKISPFSGLVPTQMHEQGIKEREKMAIELQKDSKFQQNKDLAKQFMNMKFVQKGSDKEIKNSEIKGHVIDNPLNKERMTRREKLEENNLEVPNKFTKLKLQKIKEDKEIKQYFINQVNTQKILKKNKIIFEEVEKILDDEVLGKKVDSEKVQKLKNSLINQKKRLISTFVSDYKILINLAKELEEKDLNF